MYIFAHIITGSLHATGEPSEEEDTTSRTDVSYVDCKSERIAKQFFKLFIVKKMTFFMNVNKCEFNPTSGFRSIISPKHSGI